MKQPNARDAIAISENDIVQIIERYPRLSAFGFGCFGQYHPDYPGDNPEELKRDRKELRGSVDQCQRVCDWLAPVEKARSINRSHSSYGLKYQVERRYNPFYCCNGAFIVAAIFLGFECQDSGPDGYFNFEQKSLDRSMQVRN